MGDSSMPQSRLASLELVDLSLGWSFKQTDDVGSNTWSPVRRIPSTIHQDLIDNNKYG